MSSLQAHCQSVLTVGEFQSVSEAAIKKKKRVFMLMHLREVSLIPIFYFNLTERELILKATQDYTRLFNLGVSTLTWDTVENIRVSFFFADYYNKMEVNW